MSIAQLIRGRKKKASELSNYAICELCSESLANAQKRIRSGSKADIRIALELINLAADGISLMRERDVI